jgi:hypothetical protein
LRGRLGGVTAGDARAAKQDYINGIADRPYTTKSTSDDPYGLPMYQVNVPPDRAGRVSIGTAAVPRAPS